MAKKIGIAGRALFPASPEKAEHADPADPGEAAKLKSDQVEQRKGKYGQSTEKPHKFPQDPKKASVEGKTGWIEIELVDDRNEPVAGARYRVTLPDGEKVDEGTLDEKGWARVEGFKPGECEITFPELDKDAWKFIEASGAKEMDSASCR